MGKFKLYADQGLLQGVRGSLTRQPHQEPRTDPPRPPLRLAQEQRLRDGVGPSVRAGNSGQGDNSRVQAWREN